MSIHRVNNIDTNIQNYTLSELMAIAELQELEPNEIVRKTNTYIKKFEKSDPTLSAFFIELQSQLLMYSKGLISPEETDTSDKIVVDVNKNPTKKGIKVKFFPVNENGEVLTNLTPEEVDTLQSSISTAVSKKFVNYGLEFDRDTDAPDKMAANFQIPLDSIFSFIRDKVLGGGEESNEAPAETGGETTGSEDETQNT
jgi:hypothetical protein